MKQNAPFPFLVSILLAALLLPTLSFAKTIIVYPRYEWSSDPDGSFSALIRSYPVQLLTLCLAKSGEDFELQLSKTPPMREPRAILELRKGVNIHVLWTMTSKERESTLLPIRIPIDRGAIGWRIFLINKNDQPKFDKVKTLDDLKRYAAGQAPEWPDTEILIANGLRVVPSSADSPDLPKMLAANRIDYFPRSILEIWTEAAMEASKGIVVEKTIALHYSVPSYFFVNKNNKKLAEKIKKGFEIAIKDGSFQKLFDKFNGQYIIQTNLKSRKVFELKNPLLPPGTPLNRKEYWLLEEQR